MDDRAAEERKKAKDDEPRKKRLRKLDEERKAARNLDIHQHKLPERAPRIGYREVWDRMKGPY